MDDISFLKAAKRASEGSTCSKKHLGCILVCKNGNLVNGMNGPPDILPVCGECRKTKSGVEYGWQCRAIHAEQRVLLRAAKAGFITDGATLYSYMGIPCKDCFNALVEAGIKRIVCINDVIYDEISKEILDAWRKTGGILDIVKTEDSDKKFHEPFGGNSDGNNKK